MKEKLSLAISELRADFNEVHNDLEWGGLEDTYPKASQVYRDIEQIEELIKQL